MTRFEIVEAWYAYRRLSKMSRYFRPSPSVSAGRLSPEARAVYREICRRWYVPQRDRVRTA